MTEPSAPKAADIVRHIRNGGRFIIKSYTRATVVDAKCLAKFEAAGIELFRDEDNGIRMRQGNRSVYMLPMHFALI